MQSAVESFVRAKNNGLLLIDMPTGTGKTYNFIKIAKSFLLGKYIPNVNRIFYITPLKKNIQDVYDELKNELNFNEKLFNNKVLWLKPNVDVVIEALGSKERKNIPIPIKDLKSFKELDENIKILNSFNQKDYKIKSLIDQTRDNIRKIYEPNFRKELKHLIKKSPYHLRSCKEWINSVYSASVLKDKKVVLLSADKFYFSIDPIITNQFKFIASEFLDNSLVFIDEFDSAKDTFLNAIINSTISNRIDLFKLFRDISSRISKDNFPEKMFLTNEAEYKITSKEAFEKMKKIFLDLEKKYHLDCFFKLQTKSDTKYFMFNDISTYTITTGKKKWIDVKYDSKNQINNIELKDSDNDYGNFNNLISETKGAISYFIGCCRIISKNYLEYYNSQNNNRVRMVPEQAILSILDMFALSEKSVDFLLTNIIDDYNKKNQKFYFDLENLDFYQNGFRYHEFNDDINHDISTEISACVLNNTPEKFLVSLCEKARVVGMSATATNPTVINNFDLEYVKDKLQDKYYDIPILLKEELENSIKSKLRTIDTIKAEICSVNEIKEYKDFSKDFAFNNEIAYESMNKILQSISHKKDYEYELSSFYKVFKAIFSFTKIDQSKILLVVANNNYKINNENYKNDNGFYSITLIEKLLKILFDNNIIDNMPNCLPLYGSTFEQNKQDYIEKTKQDNKIILFSSYPTVSTGQNLQYEEESFIEDSIKKDIDSIYLEKPTNIIVHPNNLLANNEALIKQIYFVGALKECGVISDKEYKNLIENTFIKYTNANVNKKFSYLYDNMHVHNAIIKNIEQAVGRLCRTQEKMDITILFDERIAKEVDFNYMGNRIHRNEFLKLVEVCNEKYSKEKLEIEKVKYNTRYNKYLNINNKINKYIEKTLASNIDGWSAEEIKKWNDLRIMTLKYPTIDNCEFSDISHVNKKYYFEFSDIKNNEYYVNEDDGILENYECSTELEKYDFDSTRMNIYMQIPLIKKYFEEEGYATNFEKKENMILPVVLHNIYKGAVGEEVVKCILNNYGLKVDNIVDGKKFEKFDFVITENERTIYIDAKNWSSGFEVNREKESEKVLSKLEKINGVKAFYIKAYAEKPTIIEHVEGKIVECSGLIKGNDNEGYCLDETIIRDLIFKIKGALYGSN